MRFPTLEEIKLTTIEMDEIRELFIKFRVGETPVYSDLSHLDSQRLEEVLSTLDIVLSDMNVHPKFPYPYYIISSHTDIETSFPILKSFELISKYFQRESTRMTNKEQRILDKIEIISSQVRNEDIAMRLNEYKMAVFPQRMIKTLAKEAHFLEKVTKLVKGK